ncbi:hypothetical protein OHA21_05755 [Actinoplanes sp. NBC_00393]|uniref:hypothetical protein n=1 Tax=Actinoplanes sp. NBC_00393 TaxID=2975953 RepID=UPI002E21B6F9
MRSHRVRRYGAGLAAVLGLLAATAMPAAAAAKPTLHLEDMTLEPGGPAKSQFIWVSPNPVNAELTLHDVDVTIDTTGLAGVATVKLLNHVATCTTTGPVYTCQDDILRPRIGDMTASILLTDLSFTPVGAAGAQGQVKITMTSREQGTVVQTATISVEEKVESALAVGGEFTVVETKPGGTFRVPLDGVRNEGEKVVDGVVLTFGITPEFQPARLYTNCEYGTTLGYCHFDTKLQPGTVYALAGALTATVPADLPAPLQLEHGFGWVVHALSGPGIQKVRAQNPKRGTGGTLTLTAQGAPSDTEYHEAHQTVVVRVGGKQSADITAIGAEVQGDVGSTVEVEVGIENSGPAAVYGPGSDPRATVTLPEGTTALDTPQGCTADAKNKLRYVCVVEDDVYRAGTSTTWPFPVRIDKAGTLTGTVAVAVNQSVAQPTGNDTAEIVLNGPGDGGSGGGGTLPITGAPIALVTGVGVLLLAGGAAAYVIGRRRRAKFTA